MFSAVSFLPWGREYEMPTWPGGERARGTQQEPHYTTSVVSKAWSRFETPVTQPRWHTQPRRQGNRAYSIHSCTQGQCFSFKTEVVCLFIQHVNILQFYFVDSLVWVKEALCIKYQIKKLEKKSLGKWIQCSESTKVRNYSGWENFRVQIVTFNWENTCEEQEKI